MRTDRIYWMSPNSKNSSERIVIAFHEAGHAVIAVVEGLTVGEVHVFDLNRSFTEVKHKVSVGSLKKGLTYIQAGYEATLKYTLDDNISRRMSELDGLRIEQWFSSLQISYADRIILLNKTRERAKNLVADHWIAIQRVAEELIQATLQGTLFSKIRGERVEHIVRECNRTN